MKRGNDMDKEFIKLMTSDEKIKVFEILDKNSKVEFLKCIEFNEYVILVRRFAHTEDFDMIIDILIENNRHVELYKIGQLLPEAINLKIINFFAKREENSFIELSSFLTISTLTEEERNLIKVYLLSHYNMEYFYTLEKLLTSHIYALDIDYKIDLLNVFLHSPKDIKHISRLFHTFKIHENLDLLNPLMKYIVDNLSLEAIDELLSSLREEKYRLYLYDYIINVSSNKAFLFKKFKDEKLCLNAIKTWVTNQNNLELSVYANFILNGLNGTEEEIALLDYKYNELLLARENNTELNDENQDIARK